MVQSMGLQRVRHNLVTEQQQSLCNILCLSQVWTSNLEYAWGLWHQINIYSWPGIFKEAGDDKNMKLVGIERLNGEDAFNQEATS